jgi:DNA-binding NtrC family response regulator
VGSNKTLSTDLRIVAATNKNLRALVQAGTFREDLFFRLSVVEIDLPPLRDRLEDIPLLANVFVKEFAQENNKSVTGLSPEAAELLTRYRWPGNVRELRTAIEHAVVLCRGDRIMARDLPATLRNPDSVIATSGTAVETGAPGVSTLKSAEKQLIINALNVARGNRTLAAQKIGMSRRTFHRRLHEYQLEGL